MAIRAEQPRLMSVALVRRFRAQDVRRTQFSFEDEFKDLIKGEATVLNAPPTPDAPRFMMTDGKRTLVVSNTSVQLSLDFGTTFPPKLTLEGALDRPARTMDAALGRIFPDQTKFYSAIIIVWVATQMNISQLSEELAEWVLKPSFQPQLNSFATTVGLERKGTSRVIEISQYKSWHRTAAAGPGGALLSVDPDFEPADDQGLQIKIDVNTKPQISSPPKNALQGLIPIIKETISVDLPGVVGAQIAAALPQ